MRVETMVRRPKLMGKVVGIFTLLDHLFSGCQHGLICLLSIFGDFTVNKEDG